MCVNPVCSTCVVSYIPDSYESGEMMRESLIRSGSNLKAEIQRKPLVGARDARREF